MDRPDSAILFDAVGTLIVPDPSVAEAYHAAGVRYGSSLPLESIRSRFRAAFARQEALDKSIGHRTSEAYEHRRWRTIIAEIFDDVSDTEELFQFLWAHFAQPEHWHVADDVALCLKQLNEAGFFVGIASNFDGRLEAICRAHPALAAMQLFVSSRIGYKKPAAQFFAAIEQSLNLSAEQILLVGDDLENDFHAARRAGWQALLLDPHGQNVEQPGLPKLRTLGELPALLRSPFFSSSTR